MQNPGGCPGGCSRLELIDALLAGKRATGDSCNILQVIIQDTATKRNACVLEKQTRRAREEIVGDYSIPGIITQHQGLLLSTRDYCEPIVKRVGY